MHLRCCLINWHIIGCIIPVIIQKQHRIIDVAVVVEYDVCIKKKLEKTNGIY